MGEDPTNAEVRGVATQDTLRRKEPNKRSDVKNTNTETWRTQQTLKGGGPKHAKIVCVCVCVCVGGGGVTTKAVTSLTQQPLRRG